MVEARQITGQPLGELLAHVLNWQIDKRDRRTLLLQRELGKLVADIQKLTEKLPGVDPGADWPDDIKRLRDGINGFLETCAEYPKMSLARSPGIPARLVQEFEPINQSSTRRHAIGAVCGLVRYGLLDRVRRCLRCGRWFFAKKSDGKYCTRGCQTKPTEEYRQCKREYAKRRYRETKDAISRKSFAVSVSHAKND
jgi:hypothetical protein